MHTVYTKTKNRRKKAMKKENIKTTENIENQEEKVMNKKNYESEN